MMIIVSIYFFIEVEWYVYSLLLLEWRKIMMTGWIIEAGCIKLHVLQSKPVAFN